MKACFKLCLTVVVIASVVLLIVMFASRPTIAAGPWYVTPGGDDGNDCLSPGTPCATINGAVGKASSGDTIFVATGTYTGTGDQVVLLDKDATLSGGWDVSFTSQYGTSTVDGEASRRGATVTGGVIAVVERFTMRNGSATFGGGILTSGTMTLNNSTVSSNTATLTGGIRNDGTLTLNNSTVSGNTATYNGGIRNDGTLALNNSTVSGNTASYDGGCIYNGDDGATLTLSNSTVSSNTASGTYGNLGGGIRNYRRSVTLQNSILAGNIGGEAPDCYITYGTISSSGYSLIGDTTGCGFTPGPGDLLDIDPRLFILVDSPGHHPLRPGSPAIDTGNPAGCTDHLGNPVTTDQRGAPRPVDGDGDGEAICDIGSYEFDPYSNPLAVVHLPVILRNR